MIGKLAEGQPEERLPWTVIIPEEQEYPEYVDIIYPCMDGTLISIPCPTETLGGRGRSMMVPRSGLLYWKGDGRIGPAVAVIASGVAFDKLIQVVRSATTVRTLTFPQTVRGVADGSFVSAMSLRSVVLSPGLEQGGGKIFESCTDLKSIYVRGDSRLRFREDGPNARIISCGDVVIGKNLLKSLKQLRQVMMPNSIDRIGNYWFAYSGVETVVLPASVRQLGEESFRGCERLVRVVLALDSRLQVVGHNCFRDSGLCEFGPTPGLRAIDDGGFQNCRRLRHIQLPASLERIGESAFRRSGLEAVAIPARVRTLEEDSFCGCAYLKQVTFQPGTTLQVLAAGCFRKSGLEELVLPATVCAVQARVFEKCPGLRVVYFADGCEVRVSKSGLPGFTKACPLMQSSLDVCVWTLRYTKAVVIPDGLERIGPHWFSSSEVESVVVPASVQRIGLEAFYRCARLRTLKYGKGSKLRTIGRACFMESGLEETAIPPGVEVIREYTFCGCTRLRTVGMTYGCLLRRVEDFAFCNTPLGYDQIPFPGTTRIS